MHQSLCENRFETWGGLRARSRPSGGSCFSAAKEPAGSRLRAGSPPHKAVFRSQCKPQAWGSRLGTGHICYAPGQQPMIRLFKVSIPSSAVVLVISDAVLLFSCYLLAAWLTIDVPLVKFLFEDSGYWHIAFVMAVIMLGLYFNDLYEHYKVRSRIELIQRFCLALGIAFLLQSLVSYAQWGVLLPKWVMVYGSLLALVVLPLWRMFFTALASSSLGAQKLLFLGSSPAVREIAAYLNEHPEFGLAPIGYLDDGREDSSNQAPSMTKLGSIAQLDEVLAEHHPSRVVVGLDPLAPESLPVER